MKKLKLTPVFMLATVFLCAAVPTVLGISFYSIGASAAIVVTASCLLDRVPSAPCARMGQRGEAGELTLKDVEAQYKETQTNLKKIGDELKTHAEQSKKEIQNHRAMSEETKAKVDELLSKQGELQARLQTAEQLLVSGGRGQGDEVPKTLGGQFAEAEGFEEAMGRMANGAKMSFSSTINAKITSDSASGGDLVEPQRVPGVMAPPEQRLFIRDLLSWGSTESNSIEYVRETGFTNNADVVSENPASGKPESNLTFEADSAKVATIAHWLHATRQIMSDFAMLRAYVDNRLRYGLKLKEEAQLLKGSGVGLNINGLYTQASAYSNPGVDVQQETIIDRLRIAMLQVELAEYPADGFVLNPIDWATIELTKDSQNRYIMATPTGRIGPSLWGRPVSATQSMDQNEFMTGSFQQGAMAWDREQVTVAVSTEDRDNFIKNMVTLLCEERVGLTVFRPEAFVKGNFDGLTGSGA